MGNSDRISELYKGEIWTPDLQQRAQERIHWLVDQAKGRVLDVGCSQGIASLLLARRGFEVVGIDVEADRIAYAEADRMAEPEDVAARVEFLHASGFDMPFDDDSFDTVLLGEVLEHLDKPDALLEEVVRVLRPDGVAAITVPFGLSPHHDHRDTFYCASLVRLVGAHLGMTSLDVVDRYLRATASPRMIDQAAVDALIAGAQPALEREFLATEEALLQTRQERIDLRRENGQLRADLRRRTADLAERATELKALERELARVPRLERTISGLREREDELTFQRDRLKWQIQSMRARRFWRLGSALAQARRSRRDVLRLPLTLLRIVVGPPVRPKAGPPQRREPGRSESAAKTRDRGPAPSETRSVLELRKALLAPPPTVRLRDLRVAAVLDTFSEASFSPECELLRFRPDNWEETLEQTPPHLLFVESAWQGNGGSWQYQVGSYTYAESVGLPPLTRLVTWCRDRGIPTVFWNKEDPIHFDKFAEAARLFDVVLTTDADCIPRYTALPGLRARTVEALPFAAQPAIHNPIGAPAQRAVEPVFGGTYYQNRHPERRAQLEMLLDAARPLGLQIYDRTWGKDGDTGFPERFHPHIRGGLPYDEMVRTYKRHRVFLNANSVFASPTMFSRRVFELLACGTAVVSTPSVGVQRLFDGVVQIADNADEAGAIIRQLVTDDARWRELSAAGLRRVMSEHTYAHRLAAVAAAAGYDLPAYPDEDVVALVLDDEGHPELGPLVDGLVGQRPAPVDVLVGTVGSVPAPAGATVVEQAPDAERSDRYRDLALRTSAPWLLVLEPRHRYGVDLLADLIAWTRFADAEVLGTAGPVDLGGADGHAHGGGADGSAGEHRYVDAVHPHAALVRRELLLQRGWPDGADAAERQREWTAEGVRIYAGSRDGFAARRA